MTSTIVGTDPGRHHAAVVSETGEILGHAQVADRVARVATVLAGPGMLPGEVVALLSDTSAAALEVLWGARQAGLVLLPLDPSLSLDELAYVINDSGARVLVVAARYAELASSLAALTPYVQARFSLDAATEGHRSLPLARSTASPSRDVQAPPGTLHYSASLTGRPTAFRVRDLGQVDGELDAVLGPAVARDLGPETSLVTVCPVSDPVSAHLASAVHDAGGTVVTVQRATPDRLLQAMSTHRATIVHLSPGGAIRLAKLPRTLSGRPGSGKLRVALLSAPSCPRDVLVALIDRWGPILRQLYVSPGRGVVAALDSDGLLARPTSLGLDPRGLLEVVDDDGVPVPAGVEGWVLRRGLDETRLDRGHLDAAGYLYLADRESFEAEAGGVIVPREIENALVAHPAVAGAAVIGLTDMGVARGPIAFVERAGRPQPGERLEAELLEYLRARIPAGSLPRRIIVTGRLPRTASGKLDKRRLVPRNGFLEEPRS